MSTQRDLRTLHNWLESRNERRRIYEILAEELDLYLSEFFIHVRKNDETEYEPGSLQAMKSSFDRELKDNDPKFSLNDRIFSLSQKALAAKNVNLKKQRKGRKEKGSKPISPAKEEHLRETGQLGGSTPRIMLWFFFTKVFGLRGRDSHRHLKYGDVTLRTTLKGHEYLEYAERESKTQDGTKPTDYRSMPARLYATGTSSDSVMV